MQILESRMKVPRAGETRQPYRFRHPLRFLGCKTNYEAYHAKAERPNLRSLDRSQTIVFANDKDYPFLGRIFRVSNRCRFLPENIETKTYRRDRVRGYWTIQDRTSIRIRWYNDATLSSMSSWNRISSYVQLILVADDRRPCYRRIYKVNYHWRIRQIAETVFGEIYSTLIEYCLAIEVEVVAFL